MFCGDPLGGGRVGLPPPATSPAPQALRDAVNRKNKNRWAWKNEQICLSGRRGGDAKFPVPDTIIATDYQSCTLD